MKGENVKAFVLVGVFIAIIVGVAICVNRYLYSGAKVDSEYEEMCDALQARFLLNQDATTAFAKNVKSRLASLKSEFRNASGAERTRRYVQMKRDFAASAYNGVKVTRDSALSNFSLRKEYVALERQLQEKWDVVSANEDAMKAWNDMIAKIEVAEKASKEAKEAMDAAAKALDPKPAESAAPVAMKVP